MRARLALLNVQGYELSVEKVKRWGFGGTKFHVRVSDAEPHHRGLHDIEAIIHSSALDATVQGRTLAERFCTLPLLRIDHIGYGAGTKELSDAPNLLRVFIGEDTLLEQTVHHAPAHQGRPFHECS